MALKNKALRRLSANCIQVAKGLLFMTSDRRIQSSLLADVSLGGLQRIQFEAVLFHFLLNVRREGASTLRPFDGRLTVGLAIRARCIFNSTLAAFAGLHDGITSPPVVGTAAFLHEDALRSHFHSLANHGDQPPFLMDFLQESKPFEIIDFFNFTSRHKKKSNQKIGGSRSKSLPEPSLEFFILLH